MGGMGRSFSAGHFALELDGAFAGFVRNVQGGGAVAEVVQEKLGADHIVRKHIGAVRYDDIVVTFGAGMSKAFYDWVGGASRMKAVRKDGAVVVLDGSNNELSRLDWTRGLISEIDFPALDATSKEPLSMTIKISPDLTRRVQGAGSQGAFTAKPKKDSTGSSFYLRIDGLEEACKHVTRIEPISLAWKKALNSVGAERNYSIEVVPQNPGNLMITLPESRAKGFYDWFDDFVIKGNNSQDKEKRGTLEAGPFSLEFGNLGALKMSEPSRSGGAAIRRTMVEMYCESISFNASSDA